MSAIALRISSPNIAARSISWEEFQRKYVLEVLERNNGNRTQTARDLGVDPRTIFRYLEREHNPMPSGASSGHSDSK